MRDRAVSVQKESSKLVLETQAFLPLPPHASASSTPTPDPASANSPLITTDTNEGPTL